MIGKTKSYPTFGQAAWTLLILAMLPLFWGCMTESKGDEELQREVKELKAESAALREKLTRLEAEQQTILALLKAGAGLPAMPETPPGAAPPSPEPLSVSRLLAQKEQFIGTRVTVKGPVGPVLVHHKSLMLKAPEGLVEVFFGSLPDPKLVVRLTSITIEHPITVTGVVSLSQRGSAKLQIAAEAVDF
jgi:hypothetical protein